MKRIAFASLTIIFFALIGSCTNDKYNKLYPAAAATCDTSGTISYSNDIAPIIANTCSTPGLGCHDAAGSSTSGYDYSTYGGLTGEIATLPGVLVNDINFTPLRGYNDMPKNANQLPQCDIEKITRWINQGYPNN